jgi:hypothetical protein
MAKNKSIIPAAVEEKKGCGCAGEHGAGYEVPEPYLHTDGVSYLWKNYVVNDKGVQLPAKQIFKLAGGEQLCEDCVQEYPVLATYITDERTDNGKAAAIVARLFDIQSPLLSAIPPAEESVTETPNEEESE